VGLRAAARGIVTTIKNCGLRYGLTTKST